MDKVKKLLKISGEFSRVNGKDVTFMPFTLSLSGTDGIFDNLKRSGFNIRWHSFTSDWGGIKLNASSLFITPARDAVRYVEFRSPVLVRSALIVELLV